MSDKWHHFTQLNDGEEALDHVETQEQAKITKKVLRNSYSVDRILVNAKSYHDKFMALSLPKPVQESLYFHALQMLEHRDGTNYEDLCVIDQRTGALVVSQITSTQIGRTGLTYAQYQTVQAYPGAVVLLHNHPNNSRPSIADILTVFKYPQISLSVVAAHNGQVMSIRRSRKVIDIENIYSRWYNYFVTTGNLKREAVLLATDKIYESGAIIYV